MTALLLCALVVTPPSELRLSVSEVCFRGDHVKQIPYLLRELDYKFVAPVRTVDSKAAVGFLTDQPAGRDRVRKAAYLSHGWTHLVDPELVIMWHEKVLARLTKTWKTEIVAWICQGTSGTVGFSFHESGVRKREVLVIAGKASSKGKRLAKEGDINWRTADEDDVTELLTRFGPTYDELGPGVKYQVYDLQE